MKIDKVKEAKEKLDDWFGAEYQILHEWTDDYAFYLVVLYEGTLYFMRIFNLFCDTWEISQDGYKRLYYADDTEIIDGGEFARLES